jgi:hypothetical protein
MQRVRQYPQDQIMLTRQGVATINLSKSTSHSEDVAANSGDTYLKPPVKRSGSEDGKHLCVEYSSPPLCYVVPMHQY